MFNNSSPLNWHNTLKRLKKGDELGRSPHSLKHLIVKRKPASAYIAHATADIVKSVDKPHKEVPGFKKLVKESGASSGSEIIADATAPVNASHVSAESRVGEASQIYTPSENNTPSNDSEEEFKPVLTRTQRKKAAKSAAKSAASDSSFVTARDSPSPKREGDLQVTELATPSATQEATRRLFQSTAFPAASVANVSKRSPIGRAKGAADASAVKSIARPAPQRHATTGRFLSRATGTVGRTNVAKDALKEGAVPKRKRKSPLKPAVAMAAPQENPPQPLTEAPKAISAGVGPSKRHRSAAAKGLNLGNYKPPAPTSPAPAPAPASPGHPTHYDQFKNMKAPGLQKLLKKHGITSVPAEHMQSPQKIKKHLRGLWNL